MCDSDCGPNPKAAENNNYGNKNDTPQAAMTAKFYDASEAELSNDQILDIEKQLLEIAAARKEIDRFRKVLRQYRYEEMVVKARMELHDECMRTGYNLDHERKSHAEELRLINQDINHLEDVQKKVRATHHKHKSTISCQAQSLNISFRLLNRLLINRLSEQNSENAQTQDVHSFLTWDRIMPPLPPDLFVKSPDDETKDAKKPRIATFVSSLPTGLSLLSMFATANTIKNESNTPSRTILGPRFSATTTGWRGPMSINRAGILPIMPSMSSYAESINREESSKLKTCMSCQQRIHRNAPICPFCKSKITSKLNKRNRK
ncbi:zinc finger-containing protein [Ditylenchus destructor]|nr:zinc finger-containing protein [Ditylenchus destructor]